MRAIDCLVGVSVSMFVCMGALTKGACWIAYETHRCHYCLVRILPGNYVVTVLLCKPDAVEM